MDDVSSLSDDVPERVEAAMARDGGPPSFLEESDLQQPEPPPAPEAQAIAPGARPRQGCRRAPKPGSIYGAPRKRTPSQHALPTTQMREKHAQRRYHKSQGPSYRQAAVTEQRLGEIVSPSAVPPRASFVLQKPRWVSSARTRRQLGSLRVVSVAARRNSGGPGSCRGLLRRALR